MGQNHPVKLLGIALVALLLSFTSLAGCKEKKAKKRAAGAADFSQKLPSFSLKDPEGKTFTSEALGKNGMVMVVTAPILSSKDAQEGWEKELTNAKLGSKAKLVFLEDMEPSAFKDTARSRMKKEYEPGTEPILLLDESGKTRSALKVPEKKTVVLVYDKDGKLVHAEKGEPNAQRARAIWEKARE